MGNQQGTSIVEFALIALIFFTVIFGLIESARVFFVVNALTEMTRRGARIGTVCPPTDPKIMQQTLFNDSSSNATTSSIINGITSENVKLTYLADSSVGEDSDYKIDYFDSFRAPETTSSEEFDKIKYVSVKIINYQHTFLFPPFSMNIGVDQDGTKVFAETILPREALGVICNFDVSGNCTSIIRNYCPY